MVGRLDGARTLLLMGAHADDIEIGCGGTILRWLEERTDREVRWVVWSGDDVRADEARRSAETFLLGCDRVSVVVETFRDAFFPDQYAAIKTRMHELAEDVDPDIVLTHRRDDLHQDHRLIAELTWNAFRRHLVLEYEIPKYEGELGHPNLFVSLTREQCERKVTAILDGFPSQAEKPWFSADTLWALLRLRGVEAGSPTGFAEGLMCRKLVL